MKIIGITGNTGSGKSFVSKILKDNGALIMDADEVAHEIILKKNPAYNEILDFFGREILDTKNEIDRKKLGAIVFSDKAKLDYLSKIVHRYVVLETESMIEQSKDNTKLFVIDAPLLIEAGMHKICDEVWLVYANQDVRLARIMKRDYLSKEEALLRIQNQTSFDMLKPYADKIINNESGYEAVLEQVKHVLCN